MFKSLPRIKRLLLRLLACLALIGMLLWAAFELAVHQACIPPSLLADLPGTPVLLDCRGRLIAELPGKEARLQFPVSSQDMNPWLLRATIGLEDRRFMLHQGFDLPAVAAALWSNLRSGRVVAGASTITQQLIKNARPRRTRSLGTKLDEFFTAIKLERQWSKEQILQRYLNLVDYGNRFLGVEAAARQYFGKSANLLTPQECIFLAALPRAPTRYNPWRHSAVASARYQSALLRLVDAGVLTFEQSQAWQASPHVLPRQPTIWQAPHFVSWVRQQSPDLAGRVHCTLDLGLQSRVESIVTQHLQRLARHEAKDAAVLIMDHQTGGIRAWIGSPKWTGTRGRINGVTLPRSAGSILKPLLYLQAIDERILTAATLMPDTPDAISAEYVDYDPRNYDQRFWGPVRVREALANSLNVPAVVTLARLGARKAFTGLQNAGIRTARDLHDYGAGLILGNAEIRLLDITAAFGVFANQGRLAQPRFTQDSPAAHRIISSPESAQILADILSDNEARRKSFGPFTPLAFESRRIPCKTGTSSGFRDAWTVGSTGRHTIGVWLGNFSGSPMKELASVTGPAPLWRDIIVQLLGADPDLPPPLAIRQAQSAGNLRADGC